VFRERTGRRGYCALGSVKSNIGHTSSAAGVASVQKVLLSLRHESIAPTLHVERENRHFDFANSPFHVNRQVKPWRAETGRVRRACVNSFGYSGTNAHVVIEEYVAPQHAVPTQRPVADARHAIVLSARDIAALSRRLVDLLGYLDRHPASALAAIAYTSQCLREPMDRRVAFVVAGLDELVDQAHEWLAYPPARAPAIAPPDADTLRAWTVANDLERLAGAWVAGADIAWDALHGASRCPRADLPLYPFARERYWVGKATPVSQAQARQDNGTPDTSWIEDVLSRVENDELKMDQAVALLNAL
jgi:acyl transferase domain-containing protein